MKPGSIFPAIKVVELVCGLLLPSGVLVPLALTLRAPIIVDIVLFHLILDPANLPVGLPTLILELSMAWAYRASFGGLLEVRAAPSV